MTTGRINQVCISPGRQSHGVAAMRCHNTARSRWWMQTSLLHPFKDEVQHFALWLMCETKADTNAFSHRLRALALLQNKRSSMPYCDGVALRTSCFRTSYQRPHFVPLFQGACI